MPSATTLYNDGGPQNGLNLETGPKSLLLTNLSWSWLGTSWSQFWSQSWTKKVSAFTLVTDQDQQNVAKIQKCPVHAVHGGGTPVIT